MADDNPKEFWLAKILVILDYKDFSGSEDGSRMTRVLHVKFFFCFFLEFKSVESEKFIHFFNKNIFFTWNPNSGWLRLAHRLSVGISSCTSLHSTFHHQSISNHPSAVHRISLTKSSTRTNPPKRIIHNGLSIGTWIDAKLRSPLPSRSTAKTIIWSIRLPLTVVVLCCSVKFFYSNFF